MNIISNFNENDKIPVDGTPMDTSAFTMPLESPTEPVQTFSEGEGYPYSGDDVKRTSELPSQSGLDALEWAKNFMNQYERKKRDYR